MEFWKLNLREIGILKIISELEFWKLNLGIGVLENYLKMKILKLNLKIGILKIIWELEFWKLNLRVGVSKIKFETNWNFENHLRIEILKIKSKNWSFGN